MSDTMNVNGVELHVEDHGGEGRPVVLIHGWPLSGASWSMQVDALKDAGYRVIAYDRRGFGQSDKTQTSFDYDTLTSDLAGILESLDLHDVSLVGFSMGGGEVARYVGSQGEERLHSIVFAAAIPPYLLKTDDNPDGPLPEAQADAMAGGLKHDEAGFYDGFVDQFFSANGDGNLLVTDEQRQDAIELTKQADTNAALGAMKAFATTDFREDLAKITVPTLVIHGDSDGIVPFDGSGKRTHNAVAGSDLHVIVGGPHGINVSHADEFNTALLEFLQK